MCRQNHGVAVDYFAAGVMAFECMYGRVRKFKINHRRDHMLVNQERRLGIISYPSKYKSREMKSQEVGL
jgi:hypothetical protein